MKISIIYITARETYPMIGRPNIHQFKPLFDSLEKQTFKDFEVIICDVLYKERIKKIKDNTIDFSKYTFPIKHVDPNEFSWSLKKNLPSYADNYNLGVINSDGELLLWFNDCSELVNTNSLQLYWDWYQKGYFANALTVYFKDNIPLTTVNYKEGGIEQTKLLCDSMIKQGYWKNLIRDSRWKYVEDKNGIYYCKGEHFYGYASSSLEATLKVNGYDSNFDGQKSLNDVEMGIRLERAGYKFVCDKNLYIIEHRHIDYPSFIQSLHPNAWKNNYSLMLLNNNKNKITANDYKLNNEELAWIIKHSNDFEKYKPEHIENELLKEWFTHPPIYNLRELRNERLRKEGKL